MIYILIVFLWLIALAVLVSIVGVVSMYYNWEIVEKYAEKLSMLILSCIGIYAVVFLFTCAWLLTQRVFQ